MSRHERSKTPVLKYRVSDQKVQEVLTLDFMDGLKRSLAQDLKEARDALKKLEEQLNWALQACEAFTEADRVAKTVTLAHRALGTEEQTPRMPVADRVERKPVPTREQLMSWWIHYNLDKADFSDPNVMSAWMSELGNTEHSLKEIYNTLWNNNVASFRDRFRAPYDR